jgi:hypothetical protein
MELASQLESGKEKGNKRRYERKQKLQSHLIKVQETSDLGEEMKEKVVLKC